MKTLRRTLSLLFVTALTVVALAAPLSTGTSALPAEPPVIRVAPPAPVFDTAKRRGRVGDPSPESCGSDRTKVDHGSLQR